MLVDGAFKITDCSGSKAFWHREMVAHTRDVVCSGICGIRFLVTPF